MKLMIALSILTSFVLGCKTGYDVDSMLLLREHRLDFKKLVVEGRAREEAVAWAKKDCILESPTSDLTRLMQTISRNQFVIIKADASSEPLIHGIGAALALKTEQFAPLEFATLIGPNPYELNRAKFEFRMNDAEFDRFMMSRVAKLMNQPDLQGKNFIFVIFAGAFDERLSLRHALDTLFSYGVHVVIVTPWPERFIGATFVPQGLSVREGICIANHLLANKPAIAVDPWMVSVALIKSFAAFDALSIGTIRSLVIDTKARINQSHANSLDEINVHIAAALRMRSISMELVNASGVLRDDVKKVEKNLKNDRSFYLKRAEFESKK